MSLRIQVSRPALFPASPFRLLAIGGLLTLLAAIQPVAAQTVVGTLSRPGLQPYAVAVYEGGNKVFVADNASGKFYSFDGSTLADLGEVPVSTPVGTMLVNEASGKMYVSFGTAPNIKIAVVDAAANTLLGSLPATYTATPAMEQDAGLGKIYALSVDGMKQIDVATGSETPVPGMGYPTAYNAMAVNPVTREVFVTCVATNDVKIVDGVTLATTTIAGLSGYGMGVNWNENKAYFSKLIGVPFQVLDRDTGSIANIPADNDTDVFVFAPASNRMYTDSEINAKSTIMEGASDAFFNLPMFQSTTALAVRNATNHVYYAGQKFIGVLDDATQLLELIPVNNPTPSGALSQGIAINQTTGRVYVINDGLALNFVTVVQDTDIMARPPVYLGSKGSFAIHIVDPVSKAVMDHWFPSYPGYGDAVRPGGGRLYEATYQSLSYNGALRIYAGAGQSTLLASFETGGNDPTVPVVAPDSSRIYVTNSASGSVSVIDAATNTVITTVPVGSHPWGAAVTPDGTKVYVANKGTSNVSIIGTASNTVTGTIPVDTAPWGIAINPSGTKAYVANSGVGTVSVIDLATASVTGAIHVGASPHWVAIAPDGKTAFVGNQAAATVSVIDTGTDTVVQTLPVVTNPEGIAFLPDSSEAWVANSNPAGASSVSVINTATYAVTNITLPSDSMQTNVVAIGDPTAKFAGRVTAGGSPLSGALLRALQGGLEKGAATSNAAGDYSLFNLKPGTYDIEASAAGYATQVAAGQSAGAGRTTVINFALLGTGAPVVKLDPASLTFPTQTVNTQSAAKKVTLSNTGTAALNISSIVAGGKFGQSNTCGTSVAAGGSCTISVVFKPTAAGSVTGTVTITDNAAGSPHTIPLTGTGTMVGLSKTLVTFGAVTVGKTSAPVPITLTNQGKAALKITAIGLHGANPGDFGQSHDCPIAPATLGKGSSCTITVTFKPVAKGARQAAVAISDNGGGSPQTITLRGTGK